MEGGVLPGLLGALVCRVGIERQGPTSKCCCPVGSDGRLSSSSFTRNGVCMGLIYCRTVFIPLICYVLYTYRVHGLCWGVLGVLSLQRAELMVWISASRKASVPQMRPLL